MGAACLGPLRIALDVAGSSGRVVPRGPRGQAVRELSLHSMRIPPGYKEPVHEHVDMLDSIPARIHEKSVFLVGAYPESAQLSQLLERSNGRDVLIVAPSLTSNCSCQEKVGHNDRSIIIIILPRPG
jgi:hypothetical protein